MNSYVELATKITELQFRNREYVLVFRGQSLDHKTSGGSTTPRPSLFRSSPGTTPTPQEIERRFAKLLHGEEYLVEAYGDGDFIGEDRIRRHQILRWSILQHYEICGTPLLDVSQSLRIAASFASLSKTPEAFLYVLGVPNISGAITASDEAGLQIVRLSSACPPSALRPHIQEGFLLGEYPGMIGASQKQHYRTAEIDFGRRLVAKFRFNPNEFWRSDAFRQIGRRALYPNSVDTMYRIAESIRTQLESD